MTRVAVKPVAEHTLPAATREPDFAHLLTPRSPGGDEGHRRSLVLVVDDDLGTRDTLRIGLSATCNVHVETAENGHDALAFASSSLLAFALVDWRLPDMTGTDVVRAWRASGHRTPFVLMSAYLSTPVVVEAMKLGAVDVLDKPIDVDDICATVVSGMKSAPLSAVSRGDRLQPRSAAERWARLVCKGCQSQGDLRTLEDWARFSGVSYSSLTEACRLIGISPHDARDLMRVLRAAIWSAVVGCSPEALLDVSDRRTLKALRDRAGLPPREVPGWSVEEILAHQRFVDQDAVKVLRRLLAYTGST